MIYDLYLCILWWAPHRKLCFKQVWVSGINDHGDSSVIGCRFANEIGNTYDHQPSSSNQTSFSVKLQNHPPNFWDLTDLWNMILNGALLGGLPPMTILICIDLVGCNQYITRCIFKHSQMIQQELLWQSVVGILQVGRFFFQLLGNRWSITIHLLAWFDSKTLRRVSEAKYSWEIMNISIENTMHKWAYM